MEIYRAKEIMGNNFIGKDELENISEKFPLSIPKNLPDIKFSEAVLDSVKNSCVLALCVPHFKNKDIVNIKNIKSYIQKLETPCFYNQDWYLNEKFIDAGIDLKWCLVSKNLLDESRGLSLSEVQEKYKLFSAVELTYIFFVYYFTSDGEKLWNNDYIWCSDKDDKGDQIYVGRYTDASGLNLDGFEIHRHLKIKDNYGAIGMSSAE